MALLKYINTSEVARLTGVSVEEIRELAKSKVLKAHTTKRGWYRLSVDDVERYFGIQIDKPAEVKNEPEEVVEEIGTGLIVNEDHYREVIQRICDAKKSIKIMTGDFARFNLRPTAKQGKKYKKGTPFIEFLMRKANGGVPVRIICSDPSKPFKEESEELSKKIKPKNFSIFFCSRNHAKMMVIDNAVAYVGSANMTPAGLRQGNGEKDITPGNFEAGIITDNPEIISSINALFDKIVKREYCDGCHRAPKCPEY